eukprot:jgi/Tetstr1/454094/TSEL_041013.t1
MRVAAAALPPLPPLPQVVRKGEAPPRVADRLRDVRDACVPARAGDVHLARAPCLAALEDLRREVEHDAFVRAAEAVRSRCEMDVPGACDPGRDL